jgi:ribosomal protein S1
MEDNNNATYLNIGEKVEENKEDLSGFDIESSETRSDFVATKIGESSEFDFEVTEEEAAAGKEPMTMQEILMQEADMQEYNEGDLINGVVIRSEKDGVLFEIDYKSEGFVPASETGVSNPNEMVAVYEEGKSFKLKIVSLESKEGYVVLSKVQADYEDAIMVIEESFRDKKVVDTKVENAVKGGLIVNIFGHKGFLPASHMVRDRDIDLETFVGKEIQVVVIDFDRKKKKIIVSNKIAKSIILKEKTGEDILDKLEAGSIVKGKVSSIKNFGVFIDLGGVEGLIHISELSWCRVSNTEEVLKIGQTVDVFILGVDKNERKVSLGYKQLFPDPWVNVDDVYKVGDIVNGKVSRVVNFGAFIELDGGLEGLVHVSEVDAENAEDIESNLIVGEPVKVKILRISPDEKKIGLSLKGVDEIISDSKTDETVTIADMVDVDFDKETKAS